MSKRSNRILRFLVLILLVGLGLCFAVEKKGAAIPDKAKESLPEQKIKITLKGMAREDFAKAEALEILRHMDPNRLTKEGIDKSLHWMGSTVSSRRCLKAQNACSGWLATHCCITQMSRAQFDMKHRTQNQGVDNESDKQIFRSIAVYSTA